MNHNTSDDFLSSFVPTSPAFRASIVTNPPDLGELVSNAFEPLEFGGSFRIEVGKPIAHRPYTRIVDVTAFYAQQLNVLRAVNNAPAGELFILGGDGDIGKRPTPWFTTSEPLTAPLSYGFAAYSWYFGAYKGAYGIHVTGRIYRDGLFFIGWVDDAGAWASGGGPDKNYRDLNFEFALLIPGISSWSISIDRPSSSIRFS